MENFEALQSIDNFCKVVVKKTPERDPRKGIRENEPSKKEGLARTSWANPSEPTYAMGYAMQAEPEEPFVDVFDEEDYIRILVQCRCREQQVTFHPSTDGITVCREECHREKEGPEMCNDICRKVTVKTDKLQLDNMLFVIAKCNNNNTLEAMIPKIKR